MNVPNMRTFDGKKFMLVDSGYSTKLKAKQDAAKLRREGYNVRIVGTTEDN